MITIFQENIYNKVLWKWHFETLWQW